jgi:hypothetical protein
MNENLSMAMEVEVSLRVPNMKVPALDENGYPIDNSAVRFRKKVTVPAIPKPGEPLQLTTRTGKPFDSKVVRADWHDEKGMFVVSCQYGNRSISPDEYGALVNDPDWEMRPLV